MFRQILAALGMTPKQSVDPMRPPYTPYTNDAANKLYELLFADDLALFAPASNQQVTLWQQSLFSEPADSSVLQALALDESQESRVRYLAFSKLRAQGISVPERDLLGAIIEMPLAGGLDVLAAYHDGGVRYLNQSGASSVFENVASLKPLVDALLVAADDVVRQIGPWEQPRRPPPTRGNVRLTFLVSDGLYFGEGPLGAMQNDPSAAKIIQCGAKLLQAIATLTGANH